MIDLGEQRCDTCRVTKDYRAEFSFVKDRSGNTAGHRSHTCRACLQELASWNRRLAKASLSKGRGDPTPARKGRVHFAKRGTQI